MKPEYINGMNYVSHLIMTCEILLNFCKQVKNHTANTALNKWFNDHV